MGGTTEARTPEFFAQHSVTELAQQSDYWLEEQGRITHPMVYDAGHRPLRTNRLVRAFALIGEELRCLSDPNQAEFYTSGRSSNEAAFLYQLFVREFGANNFPDCSNYCHEPTSQGLPPAIGVGKGTCLLEDFDHADTIFVIGQNTGTNSPRMMTELHNAARRGARIVVFNPLRERALERFQAPQNPVEMATMTSTPIATHYYPVEDWRRRGCPERSDEGCNQDRRSCYSRGSASGPGYRLYRRAYGRTRSLMRGPARQRQSPTIEVTVRPGSRATRRGRARFTLKPIMSWPAMAWG